jgi:hypothetical protein
MLYRIIVIVMCPTTGKRSTSDDATRSFSRLNNNDNNSNDHNNNVLERPDDIHTVYEQCARVSCGGREQKRRDRSRYKIIRETDEDNDGVRSNQCGIAGEVANHGRTLSSRACA